MIGLGTIINSSSIAIGGIIGLLFGKLLGERFRKTLDATCGVAVIFLGIAGALEGLLEFEDGKIVSVNGTATVIYLILGAVIGEIINVEGIFEKFGEWLKRKSGSSNDATFLDAFLTASFTVCIGAMAIVGSIEDGMNGNISILVTKSILDFIIVMVMASSMGKGAIFSAIPVFVIQGFFTVSAKLIKPIMTEAALQNLSTVGSILIFCIGVNLLLGKKIRVANLIPAIFIAVAAAFLPISL